MSRLLKRLAPGISEALMTLLCGYAIALPMLEVFMLRQEGGYALWALTLGSLLLSGISLLNKRLRSLSWLALGGLAALRLLTGSRLSAALQALLDSVLAGRATLSVVTLYADVLLGLGLLLCLWYARLLVKGEPLFSAPLLLTTGLMLWFSGARQQITDFIPMILAMPLLFVHASGHMEYLRPEKRGMAPLLRALPVVLVIALLATLLTPPYRQTNPALEDQADKLRQTINDHFFFTDRRENFSLASEGYQPMGSDGLGGRPNISDVPVLAVTTDSRVYLRGSILDLYNGRRWFDSLSKERYGYTSARFAALKAGLFDMSLPAENLRAPQMTIGVQALADLPSTLFVPQRLRSLQMGEGMVPYFNSSTELFITRNLLAQDDYALSYEPYIAGTEQTNALARRLRGASDPYYDSLPETYLTLPQHLQPNGQVTQLARSIVGTERDPYLKGMLIRDYLKSHYAYTLDVPPAPSDLDFTAHFLFETKKGYCTYFATAMTVLGRAVGLNSRYVEGFVANPGEQGAASVLTGQQGHAWTEIYIPALGWVTFDATSTTGDQPPPPQEDPSSQPPPPSPETDPDSTPDPQGDTTPAPSQMPGGGQEEDQPTPEPSPEPEPEPDQAPQPEDDVQRVSPAGRHWWLWLLLMALASLFVWRARATEPRRLAGKTSRSEQQVMIYWRALMMLRAQSGQPMLPSETLRDYAQRTAPDDRGLQSLADTVSAITYGRHRPDPSRVTAAALHYSSAYSALPPLHKMLAVLRRVWHDSLAQISRLPGLARGLMQALWRRVKAKLKP